MHVRASTCMCTHIHIYSGIYRRFIRFRVGPEEIYVGPTYPLMKGAACVVGLKCCKNSLGSQPTEII